jgi:hypothetical protein
VRTKSGGGETGITEEGFLPVSLRHTGIREQPAGTRRRLRGELPKVLRLQVLSQDARRQDREQDHFDSKKDNSKSDIRHSTTWWNRCNFAGTRFPPQRADIKGFQRLYMHTQGGVMVMVMASVSEA